MQRKVEYDKQANIHDLSADNIPITYLGDEFYKGMRDRLTTATLKELSNFSKTLPEPRIYGLYNDEKHYAQTLRLILSSTTETRKLGIFLRRKILPILQQRNILLDIGPGDGQLTGWIGNSFKYTTAVDINRKIIESLNVEPKILRKKVVLEKIHSSILDANLPNNYYNLTMLAHVLYYIDILSWFETVEIAYKATKPGGYVLVALSGDQFGKAELINYFGGKAIDIDGLIKQCVVAYGRTNVELFVSKEVIMAFDLEAMLHIAGFFLYDVGAIANRNELANYIEKCCRKQAGDYALTSQQKFILIHKL